MEEEDDGFEYGDQFADYMQYESEFIGDPMLGDVVARPPRRGKSKVDEDYEPEDDDYSDQDVNEDDEEDDEYEDEEYDMDMDEVEMDDNDPEDYGDEQVKEQVQVDDEAMANAIITSIETILPPSQSNNVAKPRIRMTDLGLRISQMVILKNSPTIDQEDGEDGDDLFLEKTLSGKKRNRTGVRGRPKKVDFGFGKSTTVKLAPEVAKLMGQANMSFVQRHYDQAIQLLQEVIRQASGSFEPYHTLGLIYEEMGQLDKAFSYFLLSAHLSKGDVELWNKLTMLAIRLGLGRETVYCLSKVLQMGRISDPRPYWVRSRLYLELHSYHNVIWSLVEMLRRNFSDLEQWQAVARLALRINLSYDATKIFTKLIEEAVTGKHPSMSVEWSHLNLLLEMCMVTKNWEGLVEAVERFAPMIYQSHKRNLQMGTAFTSPDLSHIIPYVPIDIQVKMAIALVQQRMPPNMLPCGLDTLLARLEVEDYGDLRLALGDAFSETSHHQAALLAYIPLLHHPQFGDAGLCVKIGKAHIELGNYEDAIGVLSIAYQLEPDRSDVRVALAQAYKSTGQLEVATQILGDSAEPSTKEKGEKTKMEVDLDPANIFTEVYGPTDLSLLYGVGSEIDPMAQGETGIFMADRIASLLKLPNIKSDRPHPALRRIRRRPRKIIQLMYTEDQISSVRSDYSSCLIYYSQLIASLGPSSFEMDYLAADNFLRLAGPLVEDDLPTNSHICAVDEEIKYRGTAPEIQRDLAALHGLYLDEWYSLLEKHCIVLALIGTPEKATRLLRPLFSQSAFSRDPVQATRMRLLQLALAQRANRHLGALIGSRWFLTTHPNKFASAFIYTLMSYKVSPDVIGIGRNTRMLVRNAGLDPSNLATVLMAAHNAFTRQSYEEAIRFYSPLLSSLDLPWIARARIKHQLAVCLIESSFKRTCLYPKLGFTQGFALIATNLTESPPEHKAEMTYNLARMCHECGLVRKAEPLYRAVLGMEGGFRRDAAFNLHLIYLQGGNPAMAKSVLSSHIRLIKQ